MADAAKRPLKVFLCHASGDKLPVREIYRRLVAEGVDVLSLVVANMQPQKQERNLEEKAAANR